MSGGSTIRVLVVDDHPIVRDGIAGLVAVQPDMALVAQAGNGREAIPQFRTHRPDVTLMDLQMPEMNGLDALIAIRTEFPEARVIMLTTYEGDVHILRALKAGAQGYLLKNTLHSDLLRTIRAVHAGKKSLSPEASFQIAEHMSDDALTPAETLSCASSPPECEQGDRGSARRDGGHGQGAGQEHPVEAGGQRSDARGHHRGEEGNHRRVEAASVMPAGRRRLERVVTWTRSGVSIRARKDHPCRVTGASCDASIPRSRAVGRARGCSSCGRSSGRSSSCVPARSCGQADRSPPLSARHPWRDRECSSSPGCGRPWLES